MNKNLIAVSGKLQSGKDEIGHMFQFFGETLLSKTHFHSKILDEIPYEYYYDFKLMKLRNNADYKIVKFADTLKKFIAELIGCDDIKNFESDEWKDTPLGPEWWYYVSIEDTEHKNKIPYLQVCNDKHFDNIQKNFILVKYTPRKLLTTIGTKAGRDVVLPTLWVNKTFTNYNPKSSKWVITDMRFKNENFFHKLHGGISIRVERPLWRRLGYKTEMSESEAISMLKRNGEYNILKKLEDPSECSLDKHNADWSKEFDFIIDNDKDLVNLYLKARNIAVKIKYLSA